uniref:Uncharacterized protein n=1 Tax=Meloidogyne hapla TaxID=6305 RepID=A0A1I8BZ75_MELHA
MEGFVVLQYGQGDFLHWLDGGLRGAPVWTGGFLHWLDGGLRSAPVWTGGFFALARWRLRGAPVWTGSFPTLALLQQCIIFMSDAAFVIPRTVGCLRPSNCPLSPYNGPITNL